MESLSPPSQQLHAGDSHGTEAHEVRFEAVRVRMLLDALDLADRVSEHYDDHERVWGVRRLTFASFDRLVPDFPWQLTAGFVTATERIPLRMALTAFERTPYWWTYLRAVAARRDWRDPGLPAAQRDRPLAVTVPCQGLRGGLVIHDGPAQTRTPHLTFDTVLQPDDRYPALAIRAHVELYSSWLRAVVRAGRPVPVTAPAPTVLPGPGDAHGARVAPWMIAATDGAGYDTMLLAWLCRVLLPDAPDAYARPYRSRWAGRPCVDATRERLAAATGIGSERRVTTARASLRDRGLVEHDNATRIRLVDAAIAAAMGG